MVTYDLSHLTQEPAQSVLGPVQDDECLILYALIKCMRLSRILELGGLDGYSAKNFLQAVGECGTVYTCDLNPVPCLAPNHKTLVKNCLHITPEDLDDQPLDLVFFDCHDDVQKTIFDRLVELNLITDATIIALHDTGLHFAPYNALCPWGEPVDTIPGGFCHQRVERDMVNWLKEEKGYDVLNFHTTVEKHSDAFPFRHGLTICQKNGHLDS